MKNVIKIRPTHLLNQPRIVVEDHTFQKDNHYQPNFQTVDISIEDRERYMFLSFVLNQILTILLFIVIIAIIVLTIRVTLKRR